MGITLTTPPTAEPITMADLKRHLRVLHNDDDVYLADLLPAVRQHVETITRRQLMTATYTLTVDAFPKCFVMPRPPLQSVTQIQYEDTDGNTQTLASSEYDVDTNREPGLIVPAWGATWPATRDEIQSVTVTYVAGYVSAALVPADLRHAILLLCGHLYRMRGDDPTALPPVLMGMVEPLRVVRDDVLAFV